MSANPNYLSLAHPHFSMWTNTMNGYMMFHKSQFHKNPKNLYAVPGDYTNLIHHPIFRFGINPGVLQHPLVQWFIGLTRTQTITDFWCSDKFSIGWGRGPCTGLVYWEIVPYTSSPGVDPVHPKVLEHLPTFVGGNDKPCETVNDPCCANDTENGPSKILITPIWSQLFESFLKKYMGEYNGIKCPKQYLQPIDHPCGVDPDTSNPPNIIIRNARLQPRCSPDTRDCLMTNYGTFDFCRNRNLDEPPKTFDRPFTLSSTWMRMGGAHSGRGFAPWTFSKYEYRYINFADPREDYGKEYFLDAEAYPSAPQCEAGDTSTWEDIQYFHDGIQICWPSSPGAAPSPSPSTWPGDGDMIFDTPICDYDDCWIGWEGGSWVYPVSNERGGTDYEYDEAVEEGDHSLSCPPESPEFGKHYFHTTEQLSSGKVIPHQNWAKPTDRLFDYWTILDGNWAGSRAVPEKCMNINLDKDSLSESQKKFWRFPDTFFHDPAFSKLHLEKPPHDHEELLYPDCCPYGGDE